MIKTTSLNLSKINQGKIKFSDSIKSDRVRGKTDLSHRSLITLPIIKIGEGEQSHQKRDNSKDSVKSTGSTTYRTSQYILKKSSSQSRIKTQQDLLKSSTPFKWSNNQISQESTASTIRTLKQNVLNTRQTITTNSSSVINSPQLIENKKISPPKLSQFSREKTSIIIPQRNQSSEQLMNSPSKSSPFKPSGNRGSIKRKDSNLSPIRSKQESISSMKTGSEEHSVWDNRDLIYRGVFVHNLPEKDELQQFLRVFKMRFGGFPGQQQTINNEDVIKFAITYAKVNKKMFRKYFPSNQVIFEDEVDYSQEHDLSKDPNYQRFIDFFKRLRENSDNPQELRRQYKEIMEEAPKNQFRRASARKLSKEESPLINRQREKTHF